MAPEALLVLYDPDSKPTNQFKEEHRSKLSQSPFLGFLELDIKDEGHSFADGRIKDVRFKNSE